MDLTKLKDKFPEADIEWRFAKAGIKDGRPWAMVLAYITNRAIQERLDVVCGPENWKNEFKPWHTIEVKDKKGETSVIYSQLCGISIRINEEWITKWDGAECPDFEPIKGGLSNAMKRVGVQWGIGSYLYELKDTWAVFDAQGIYNSEILDKSINKGTYYRWNPPKLSAEFLPEGAEVLGQNKPKDAMKLDVRKQTDPDESQRADIIKWCEKMGANLADTLQYHTKFVGKDDKEVRGVTDIQKLSGKRLEIAHHKIHAIYEQWEENQKQAALFKGADDSEESTIRNVIFKVLNEMNAGNQVQAGKQFKAITGHAQMSELTGTELTDAYAKVLDRYNEFKKPLPFEKPKKDADGLFASDMNTDMEAR